MKKNIIYVVFSLFLVSCTYPKGPGVIDAGIDIYYKSNTGANLLNYNVPNHYSLGQIRFFNVIDGKKYEMFGNIAINTDSLNNNYLRLSVETDSTILQLNDNISDTIVCQIDKSSGIRIKKVVYNRIIRWDNYSVPRTFTVLK